MPVLSNGCPLRGVRLTVTPALTPAPTHGGARTCLVWLCPVALAGRTCQCLPPPSIFNKPPCPTTRVCCYSG